MPSPALRPKAALSVRRRLIRALPLLLAVGCNHPEPFQPSFDGPGGPLHGGSPRQITFSPDADMTPARSGDGNSWLYAYTSRPDERTIDRCLAGLPLNGGGQTRTYCDVTYGRLGTNSTVSWPAESRAGRLAYFRTRGVAGGGAQLTAALVLGSFGRTDSGRVLRTLPYDSPRGVVRSVSHLAWLDQHTLIFVANQVQYTGRFPSGVDTIESGLQIERLDVDQPSSQPDIIAGTGHATSVEPMPDGGGFYFTMIGDSQVYRRRFSGSATDTLFNFGGLGIVRDVRVADSVVYAILGGGVHVIVNDTVGIEQVDSGGYLQRVDLRDGAVTNLNIQLFTLRHPAISGDHHRVMVEAGFPPGDDLWLVEVP